MPAVQSHALLALNTLIEELDTLDAHQERIDALDPELDPRIADAREEALARLAQADRLELFETATQALAVACARRELPQPVRAAAYSALAGLIASDLLQPATFRTLYQSWEEALRGLAGSRATQRGEEVLFHID